MSTGPTQVVRWNVEDEHFKGVLETELGKVTLRVRLKGLPRLKTDGMLAMLGTPSPASDLPYEREFTVEQARKQAKELRDAADLLDRAALYAEGQE